MKKLSLMMSLSFLLVSCGGATYKSQAKKPVQTQISLLNVCGKKEVVCPQKRSYLVTYQSCCDYPVTYKKK